MSSVALEKASRIVKPSTRGLIVTLTVEDAPFSPEASGCVNVEIDRAHRVLFCGRRSECPHIGWARHWNVRVDDRVAAIAIWAYPEPISSASFLAGYVALDRHSFDEWFVEDEQVFGRPRDPYTRIS